MLDGVPYFGPLQKKNRSGCPERSLETRMGFPEGLHFGEDDGQREQRQGFDEYKT